MANKVITAAKAVGDPNTIMTKITAANISPVNHLFSIGIFHC
jgi:hypothetical protein